MAKREKQFISSLSMSSKEVAAVLNKKIIEEKEEARRNQTPESKTYEQKLFKNAKYDPKKINILSLFSGAGGLDLGTELSAINQFLGNKILKNSFDNKNIFHKYANKILNVKLSNLLCK